MTLHSNWGNRTTQQEKVWLDEKTSFHYVRRGIDYTPPGTEVQIIECNPGVRTQHGTIKGTIMLGLMNYNGERKGQMIAWSYDPEDLILFAMEYNWVLIEEDSHA